MKKKYEIPIAKVHILKSHYLLEGSTGSLDINNSQEAGTETPQDGKNDFGEEWQ